MSTLFLRILKQAQKTFDRRSVVNFTKEFSALKQLLDQLTLADLSLNPELVSRNTFRQADKAPCTFVHIYESEYIAMSVFILDGNYTMPLHDHPNMHGILKGIAGHILIRSYSRLDISDTTNQQRIYAKSEANVNVNSSSLSAVLTPNVGNYHEITAVGGPAAFFDVLSPPYDTDIPIHGRRKCTFYRKIEQGEILILERIPIPSHYYCDSEDTPELINQLTSEFV